MVVTRERFSNVNPLYNTLKKPINQSTDGSASVNNRLFEATTEERERRNSLLHGRSRRNKPIQPNRAESAVQLPESLSNLDVDLSDLSRQETSEVKLQ